jgi:hypothetical protein
MNTAATEANPPLDRFPALSGLTPVQRIEFALVQFPDDPGLEDYLIAQGVNRENVSDLIALAQEWAVAGRRGFTAAERGQAALIIAGPPLVLDARAELSEGTRQYLKTLRPGQRVNTARIRAMRAHRPTVVNLRTPRQQRAARRCSGAVHAISGGSDDGPGDGPGDADPPSSVVPSAPASTPPASPASASNPLPDPYTSLRRRAVATRCLCCNIALSDATSAAIGMGRTCRRRVGIDKTLEKNTRANDLIARAALAAEEACYQDVSAYLEQLSALSSAYVPLVERVRKKLFKTRIAADDRGGFLVSSTWNPDSVSAFKDLGMWWKSAEKAWRASSEEQRDQALAALAETNPYGEVLMPSGAILPLQNWSV